MLRDETGIDLLPATDFVNSTLQPGSVKKMQTSRKYQNTWRFISVLLLWRWRKWFVFWLSFWREVVLKSKAMVHGTTGFVRKRIFKLIPARNRLRNLHAWTHTAEALRRIRRAKWTAVTSLTPPGYFLRKTLVLYRFMESRESKFSPAMPCKVLLQ